MECRCPACRRTTSVSEDEVDFLVRCQRCKAMFLARSVEASAAAKKRADEQAAAGSQTPPESPPVHLADLLVRPKDDDAQWEQLVSQTRGSMTIVAVREEEIPPRAQQVPRAQLRSRKQTLGMIGIAGLLGLAALTAAITLLNQNTPRQARAHPEEPQQAVVEPPQPQPTPADKQSDGDLFPDVKAQK